MALGQGMVGAGVRGENMFVRKGKGIMCGDGIVWDRCCLGNGKIFKKSLLKKERIERIYVYVRK